MAFIGEGMRSLERTAECAHESGVLSNKLARLFDVRLWPPKRTYAIKQTNNKWLLAESMRSKAIHRRSVFIILHTLAIVAYNSSSYQLIASVHKPLRMSEWNCSVLCESECLTPGFCLMHITILQPLTTTISAHHINLVYFGLNRLWCNLDMRVRRARVYPFVRFSKCVAFGRRSIATATMMMINGRISHRPQTHTAHPRFSYVEINQCEWILFHFRTVKFRICIPDGMYCRLN